MTFTNPITGGQGTLVRPAIKSPDYVPGVSGWSINRDGTAEFNDLTFRGTFRGNGLIINSAGFFLYAGAPAAGNMIGSWAPAAGTDEFGNPFPQGLALYDGAGTLIDLLGGPDDDNIMYNQSGDEFAGFYIGNLILGWNADPFDLSQSGGMSVVGDGSALVATSTANDTLTEKCEFWLSPGTDTAVSGDSDYPHSQARGDSWITGVVTKAFDNANIWTKETWHTPTFNSGWSATTSIGTLTPVPALQYRYGVEDTVVLQGSVLCASSGSPGPSIVNLPADYRPVANSAPFPAVMRTSTGTTSTVWLYLSAAGNININAQTGSAVTLGATYSFPRTEIPLGNI